MLGGWAVKQTKQSQHKRCHMCQIPRFNSRLLSLLLILGAILGAQHASGAYLDPALKNQMAVLGPSDQVQAVVNFDPTVTSGAALTGTIQNLGAGTLTFNNLDSVGILATAD